MIRRSRSSSIPEAYGGLRRTVGEGRAAESRPGPADWHAPRVRLHTSCGGRRTLLRRWGRGVATSDGSVRLERVVTPRGRSRTIVRPDAALARRYAAAVAPVVPRVERSLGARVLAIRAGVRRRRDGSPEIELAPWRPAHRRLRRSLEGLAERAEVLVRLDVRACYASVGERALERQLCDLRVPRADVRTVLRVLEAFGDAGVAGLPVGPAPSAVLANAVLRHLDRAVTESGAVAVRWVDDVWAFVESERRADEALERAALALDRLGLELAPGKTSVTAGRAHRAARVASSWADPQG